ncbi:MAG: glycosyltransferase family 2 protein [Spirochaetaceae bacterium]
MALTTHLAGQEGVDPERIRASESASIELHISLEDALIVYGGLDPERTIRASAKDLGLRFVSNPIESIMPGIDAGVAHRIGWRSVLRVGALPLYREGSRLVVLTSRGNNRPAANHFAEVFGIDDTEEILTTRSRFIRSVEHVFARQLETEATSTHARKRPDESAKRVLSRGQLVGILMLLAAVVAGISTTGLPLLHALILLSSAVYVGVIAFRFFASASGNLDSIVVDVSPEEAQESSAVDLPVYTILLPLYREPSAVSRLVQGVKRLDYPPHKLDVILLLEEDDLQTQAAVEDAQVPAYWTVLRVPLGYPRTKARACNYGLHFARGTYCVVYDAEDLPDHDQLRKTVAAFARASSATMCFQSLLRYTGTNHNVLTRLFSMEYHYLFDFMTPGLYAMSLPVPVAGSSNHFNTDKLRALGAWDAYNTTEHIDLGIRIAVERQSVGVLRSTTYEDANGAVWNWIRQRTRRLKGQLHTFLIYNRNPVKTLRNLGIRGWLGFMLFVGGTPLVYLAAPVLWAVVVFGLLARAGMLLPVITPLVMYLSVTSLMLGNVLSVYMLMLGSFHRRQYRLIPYAILTPAYQVLHSLAAWRALWQLFRRPHFWDKTDHNGTGKDTQ